MWKINKYIFLVGGWEEERQWVKGERLVLLVEISTQLGAAYHLQISPDI